ncbi:MAG: DHA2 family efflux MFS transporter permease subunit, partial [Chloroflexota bacterium]
MAGIVARKWLILLTVSLGSLMSTLDGSIVNIALPSIEAEFRIDLPTVGWVVVAYLLVVGSLLLPVGRLGEVLTFKRVYIAGFALFTAASVASGAAPTAALLIAFRVVQAVGAAMIMSMGPAIIARTFPAGERGRALGLNGVSVSLGLTMGPALGGILTAVASWRAIFLINLPIGILAVLWAWRVLPEETPGKGQRFDLRGAALSGAALFALLLALSEGQGWGWGSAPTLGLLAVALVLGIAFVIAERRAVQPLIDLALFRIRPFAFGLASVVLAFIGMFVGVFLMPWLLERGNGFSAAETGLMLTPVPIAMAIVAPFAGSAADRWGPSIPASTGIVVMVLALLSLTTLPSQLTALDLLPRLVLLGVGQGLFMSPN